MVFGNSTDRTPSPSHQLAVRMSCKSLGPTNYQNGCTSILVWFPSPDPHSDVSVTSVTLTLTKALVVIRGLSKDKDKDKEALFNVAYNVTDNISSRAILRHNNIFNRYLPALLYLPSTTPFMPASVRELLVPFFTPLVWCGRGIRAHDLPPRKRTLYQLSYRG